MRKYWYTILLTISLSGAAAARMIPDSVAEAVAAEIIDIGTDLRMTAKAYADGGQTLSEKPPAEPGADQEASSERNPQLRSQLTVLLPTTWQCPAPKTSLRLLRNPARFPQPQKFQGTAIPPLSQKSPHRTPSLSRKIPISPMCFLLETPGLPAFPNMEIWDRLRFLQIPE